MKKIIILVILIIIILRLIGLRIGKFEENIEIPTPTPTPKVYHWYFDGEKITGENPFLGGGKGLVEDYCGVGKGTTKVDWDGMMDTKCVPKEK